MPETQDVPEIYADFAQISAGNMGIFLGFRAISPMGMFPLEASESETQPETPYELKAVVRLTHADAKVFAIMLKRALKGYEQDSGEVLLPPGFAEGVNLAADEW